MSYFENYTPVGDILVLATCLVFIILIHTAYISRTKNFQIFRQILALLVTAAVAGLVFYLSMNNLDRVPVIVPYVARGIQHLALFGNLALYVMYMKEPLHLSERADKILQAVTLSGLLVLCVYEILGSILRFGFYIDENNQAHSGQNIFALLYMFFVVLLLYVILRYRSRVYKQVVRGILACTAISIVVMAVQGAHHQNSFTTASFLFPAYAILYLIHSNPYDIEIGAVNLGAFEDQISYAYRRGQKLLLMSLMLHDFEGSSKRYPKAIQDTIRHFSSSFFKGAVLFQISGGHMILTADLARNPDHEEMVQRMLDNFQKEYPRYRLDYKIVVTETHEEVSRRNDYIGLIQYLHNRMPENTVRFVTEKEITAYREHNYIVRQLEDIHGKKDMNDPRVEVFCQPVYNTRTGKYDTAEALMRLRLPDTGMVFPDRFIPIAEKYHYIHTLSLIILSKTCRQVHDLIDEGYQVKRISVNFSMLDVREEDFCSSVSHIIEENRIPFDKIAIELTESQTESDFLVVKDKVTELKETGIKFYLDDFGTGYSNFDRILELPFDIVKFDRSLVIACSNSIRSETMVSYLAHMFSDMNYSVLYEGIENEEDEQRCTNMCARYLQGYKYSKPIPIGQLTNFFEKVAVE